MPHSGEGALGTWRSTSGREAPGFDLARPVLLVVGETGRKLAPGRGYVGLHLSLAGVGKAHGGQPGSRTGFGKTDRPGSSGGLGKRQPWQVLNGHVKRKRRNSQA